jgi:hypothetical protein
VCRRVQLAHAVLEKGDVSTCILPSIAALTSNNDGPLTAELRLAELRAQLAVVRTLADHIEHLARPGDTEGLGEQLVEEMARLGCRVLEAAAALAGAYPEESGVFARRSSSDAGSDAPVFAER